MVTTPIAMRVQHTASPQETRYLLGLEDGRILGQRCPQCGKVYVPPRGACPVDGVPTTDEVELPDRGIVTTFCIVNVPFLGQRIKPPYVAAYVLLDGADIAFLHLILDCAAEDVRMGMRVEAVWKPRDEWGPTLQNIDHFRPDRRAGCRLRLVQGPSLMRDVAVVGFAQSPQVRATDAHDQRRRDAGADLRARCSADSA